MRGNITIKILETIFDGVSNISDVVSAILESGYGVSYSKLEGNFQRHQAKRKLRKTEMYERQKLYSRIYKLKREGFIGGAEKIKITNKGKRKLKELENFLANKTPAIKYKKEIATETIILTFDIPEKERYKRNWLRKVLIFLGFKFLQKSVWIGRIKLPEEFINDLKELEIFQYIEISSINKGGTLNT